MNNKYKRNDYLLVEYGEYQYATKVIICTDKCGKAGYLGHAMFPLPEGGAVGLPFDFTEEAVVKQLTEDEFYIQIEEDREDLNKIVYKEKEE